MSVERFVTPDGVHAILALPVGANAADDDVEMARGNEQLETASGLVALLLGPAVVSELVVSAALVADGSVTLTSPPIPNLKRPGFHGDFFPWKWRKDHGNQAPLIEALPA